MYLDGGVNGQRYGAYAVATSLRIRSRRAFNSTACLSYAIGRATISADGGNSNGSDTIWFLVDESGQLLQLYVTDAGLETAT